MQKFSTQIAVVIVYFHLENLCIPHALSFEFSPLGSRVGHVMPRQPIDRLTLYANYVRLSCDQLSCPRWQLPAGRKSPAADRRFIGNF